MRLCDKVAAVKLEKSNRGFQILTHPSYPEGIVSRLAQQSSIVLDYPNAMKKPGSSALWIGDHHHLDREEVSMFVSHLNHWLRTGKL